MKVTTGPKPNRDLKRSRNSELSRDREGAVAIFYGTVSERFADYFTELST
jgi:hypothetical protein